MLDGRLGSILYIVVGSSDVIMQIHACMACSREVNIFIEIRVIGLGLGSNVSLSSCLKT